MAANSPLRRILKRALRPILNDRVYRFVQATTMAWDIRRGRWREPEIDLVSLGIAPGERALDLGANYGLYSYHLSRAVGRKGRVYAFEPVPFTSRTLSLVVRLLGLANVEVINKGCSDAAGSIDFDVPVQTSGAISAGQAHMARRNDNRSGREQQVRWSSARTLRCEVVRLDEHLRNVGEVSFIKCDIEGAELFAFRGAARLIGRDRPTVICEINPWFLDGFGVRLDELVGFFTSQGYFLARYIPSPTPRLERIDDLSTVSEDNYVFIHPHRLARFEGLLQGA